MRYFFNFTQSIGLKEIDEPFGSDAVPFVIKKDKGRKGRDVNYAGDTDAKYTITRSVDRYGFYFEQFLRDWLRYSFELQIELIVDFGDGMTSLGNVANVSTNQYDTIEFIVVQKLQEAKLKNNYEVTQDISDLPKSKVIVPAKPTIQISEWDLEQFQLQGEDLAPTNVNEFAFFSESVYFNPIQQQVATDVGNSLTWLTNFDTESGANFRLLTAATNLTNLKIKLDLNVLYKYRPNEYISGLDKSGAVGIYVRYGQTYETATLLPPLWYNGSVFEVDADFQLPPTLEVTIPVVNQTDSVWLYFRASSQNAAVNRIQFSNTDQITITATSTALTTVVNCIRYIDAIKDVVNKASGLNVTAPRFELGGEFYDQFITNASLMRNIEDKPFYLSFKDIVEEHIRTELNGDYEINADSDVFIGLYNDFFTEYEVGSFEQLQYSDYRIEHDETKAIKIIKSGFKTFQSQKEEERGNTFDIVHGSMEHKTENENAKNIREAMVGFIRDAFTISEMQIKSYDVSKSAATQDDRKVVILDVVPLVGSWTETYTFSLQHFWDPFNQLILLRNQENFNWINLGVYVGGNFQILSGLNAGSYTVIAVTPTDVSLASNGGNNLIENTAVKYTIDPSVTLKARTNEGFLNIQNITEGDNYVNLRFTSKRILEKYFSQEIATYCLPTDSSVINTEYNNNPEAITQFGNEPSITEGETFKPKGAILEPFIIKTALAMTLSQYWRLAANIRNYRGFIRTWDANGMPIKGYINEGKFLLPQHPDEREGILECTLEKKYEEFYLNIIAIEDTFIINGQLQPTGFTFSIDDSGYLEIFDSTGKKLFAPVPYDRVKINNSGKAESPEQLGVWLSQYDING